MKIGVLSDTHGSLVQTKKAFKYFNDCDLIIHLGDVLYHGPRNDLPSTYAPRELAEFLKDKDVSFIRGNCDSDVDAMVIGKDISEKNKFFEISDLKIFAIHGYEESLDERIMMAKSMGANVLMWGHTHKKLLEKRDGLILLNPGSTTIPKDGSTSIALFCDGKWFLVEI